ncbi:MAG: secretin N-terminal domain-containing protein, partial [Planctomycetota bacterium]
GGGGGGDNAKSEAVSQPNKISIAVDSKSNSLVVIATPSDFEEVRGLVQEIDESGKTTEEMVSTYTINGNVNPEVVQQALMSLMGSSGESDDKSDSGASGGRDGARGAASGGTSQQADDIRRRIEFFRSLGGGAGRGGIGGGRPGGGGGPFGGGGGGGRPGGGGGGPFGGGGRGGR